MDRFAFVTLLTYSREKISAFQSWSDLKLNFDNASNSETDFEITDVFVSSGGDDGPSNYTCICGHHIQDIYKLRNKYTMTTFQVGSKCIERSGLVDSSTLKSHKKLMDAKIERQKEIDEGKPIGYYEELRKNKKAEKERAKQNKIDERERVKQLKLEEKEETAQLNKLKNKKLACSKKCIMCNTDKLFKLDDKLRICNSCVKNAPKVEKKRYVDLLNNPKHTIESNCAWCEKLFTCWSETFDACLCSDCDITIKTVKCKLCCDVFVNFRISDDLTCDECDAKLKCCVGCANTFIPKRETNIRCNLCQTRFDNNIAVIKCSDCCIDVEIKESDKKWRKKCAECFTPFLI